LAFANALKQLAFLLLFLAHLGEVVYLSFPLGLLVELAHHLVVVSLLAFLARLLHEMLVDDCYELLVALIEYLGRNECHIWLIEQEPVRVLSLEDGEVRVEKGSEALEILLSCHLLFDVVGGVDEVI